MAILSHQVVRDLIARDSLVKVLYALKVLKVVKFIFYSSVYRLDIAIVAPGPGGNPFMFGPEAANSRLEAVTSPILSEAADEFAAIVGLKLDLLQIDTAVPQVLAKQPCE